MAKISVKQPPQVVEKNIKLTQRVMEYLLANPQVFASLPDRFELVILPDDDPDLRNHNLNLLNRNGSEGRPVVFASVSAHASASKSKN